MHAVFITHWSAGITMTVSADSDPLQPHAASKSYTLRRATPADAAQLSHLIGSTWAKFFAYSVTPQDLEDTERTGVRCANK